MLQVLGSTEDTDDYVNVSFRHREAWPMKMGGVAGTSVVIGQQGHGPNLGLLALEDGVEAEPAPAHGHGSDNFRIALQGALVMGRERYGAGEFRYTDGWKVYPNELSDGPLWLVVILGDQRGFRRRLAKELEPGTPEYEAEIDTHLYLSEVFEIEADLVDPTKTSGPAAQAITLGPTSNSGKLNGSFSDTSAWLEVSPVSRAVVSLFGHPATGPVLLVQATEPYGVAMPRAYFDTEVCRLVVAGSYDTAGRIYERGDMRVQRAGTWSGPVVAGPDGLQEFVVLGDRTLARPTLEEDVWPHELGGIIAELQAQIDARSTASASA